MKTLENIETEIKELIELGNYQPRTEDGDKVRNKCRTKLRFLRPIRIYLEHEPTKESLVKQLNLSLKRLARIEEEWEAEHARITDKVFKTNWFKGEGAPKLRKQIKVCRYILE